MPARQMIVDDVSDNGISTRFAQSPLAGGPPDSRRDRLTVFATRVADAFADKGRPLETLRIELVRLGPTYRPADRRTIFELGFGERP